VKCVLHNHKHTYPPHHFLLLPNYKIVEEKKNLVTGHPNLRLLHHHCHLHYLLYNNAAKKVKNYKKADYTDVIDYDYDDAEKKRMMSRKNFLYEFD
jgi:hypothetical protein